MKPLTRAIAIEHGVSFAWDRFLHQQTDELPDLLQDAIIRATRDWLDANAGRLIEAIAEKAAVRAWLDANAERLVEAIAEEAASSPGPAGQPAPARARECTQSGPSSIHPPSRR
jgi:hypothetical protein